MNDKRILVVDDETDLLEMVKSIFTRAGFTQVLTASSGEAALKMCEEQEPDMMIASPFPLHVRRYYQNTYARQCDPHEHEL